MATNDSDAEGSEVRREVDAIRFHTRHDWNKSDEISSTIVDAVAAIVGKEPTKLQPLYHAIDPDAFDQLLQSFLPTDNGTDVAQVEFSFNGCDVSVQSDGRIWIDLPDC